MSANLRSLTALLRALRAMSTEPVTDDAEFAREVQVRRAMWGDVEGWVMHRPDGSWIQVHLLESSMSVRFFRGENSNPNLIASFRFLLNGPEGISCSMIRFGEGEPQLLALDLLERVSRDWVLEPLERSMSRALARYYRPHERVMT